MKNPIALLLLLCAFPVFGQATLVFRDFKWTVKIPAGYVESEDENDDKATLFEYKKDASHFIQASKESFDEKADGDYLEAVMSAKQDAVKAANDMFAGSAAVTRSDAVIDGLRFAVFTSSVKADEDFVLYTVTYTRLFGKKALVVNLYYSDVSEGKRLTEALLQSKFGK